MKKINLKSVLFLTVAISLSVVTYAQQNQSMMNMNHSKASMAKEGEMQQKGSELLFNDVNLNNAYTHYMMIHTALLKSDTQKVQMMSKMLVGILNKYGKASKPETVASKLAENTNIENQRKLFAELTISMEPIFKDNITKGVIYKNYCPMANGNGAYWYSNTNEIANPYFGGAMKTCGSLKETFKSM